MPTVFLKRSAKQIEWQPGDPSILDLAEQAGVRAPYSCRAGQCHGCAVGLLKGAAAYPVEVFPPAKDAFLTCCATPLEDLVLDL